MVDLSGKKNFAVIGIGGYIAEKHLKAIKSLSNTLCLRQCIVF